MAAARGLAREIAKLLGRPENEGWIFTRRFQEAGLFPIGRGGVGGSGAPRASTHEGVLLALAMASNLPAKQAVEFAAQVSALPLVLPMLYRRDASSANIARWPWDNQLADYVLTFGGMLAAIVNGLRSGQWPSADECEAERVVFVSGGAIIFGEIHGREIPHPDGGAGWFIASYGRQIDAPAAPHAGAVQRVLPVSLFGEVAKLLGPLSAASGGGGEDLAEDDDELGEEAAPALAASAIPDPPSKEVH
jgi:hypothetical protein